MRKQTDINRAQVQMLMSRLRADIEAHERANNPSDDRQFLQRDQFRAMQEQSRNVELHTLDPDTLRPRQARRGNK